MLPYANWHQFSPQLQNIQAVKQRLGIEKSTEKKIKTFYKISNLTWGKKCGMFGDLPRQLSVVEWFVDFVVESNKMFGYTIYVWMGEERSGLFEQRDKDWVRTCFPIPAFLYLIANKLYDLILKQSIRR